MLETTAVGVVNNGVRVKISDENLLVVGIDEAGRGPIIGPMVIAGVVLPLNYALELYSLGVRDSKELDVSRRAELAKILTSTLKHIIIVKVPPSLIDAVNLNKLEINTFKYIVERLFRLYGEKIQVVYVDSVGPPRRVIEAIQTISKKLKVVVEAKADKRFIPVAAASIVAKVARDREIERLSKLYGVRGSGYPTDPKTLEWIKQAYKQNPSNPPPFIRRSWSTLKKIAPGWYKPKSKNEYAKYDSKQRSLLEFMRIE